MLTKRDLDQIKKLITLAKKTYYDEDRFFKAPVEKLTSEVASILAYGVLVKGSPKLVETKAVTRKFLEVTDERYDLLEAVLRQQEPDAKLLQQTRSPVGVRQVEVKLPYLMPSLDKKFYGAGTLAKWAAAHPGPYIISDKLDGVSMELLGHNGKYDQLYKGGSATHGMDWSHAIPHLKLPKRAPAGAEVGVRAEIIMSKAEFDSKWAGKYKNSRNLTSGIVNKTKGDAHEAIGSVEPVVFDVLHKRMKPSAALAWAKTNGFKVVHHVVVNRLDEEKLLTYLEARKKADYLIDGLVIAQDKPYMLTEANPKSMIAFKHNSEDDMVQAEVIRVEWQVSRHGLLKPVLLIKPVSGGAAKRLARKQ